MNTILVWMLISVPVYNGHSANSATVSTVATFSGDAPGKAACEKLLAHITEQADKGSLPQSRMRPNVNSCVLVANVIK